MQHYGFSPLDEFALPEYRAVGRWLRHERSGAEVFHVVNDDPENLFSFVFKTLPPDSTGVAHILEHTVLCGSRRYPLKDPFILLVKGSLNTFLNAMTYPDKTVYPASSTVEQDLFNIMQVYGDSVFFPLLRPEFFMQEGHRVQSGADGRLEITGIVYNEMKGEYANHDSLAADWGHRVLLPDTPYGFDSGGDPAAIPDLTYEAFVDFHRTYYHPSNTRVFLYGNIPTERYLELLDREFFSRFDRLELDFPVPRQPRWSQPRELEVTCPADSEDGGTTSITTSWLLDAIPSTDRLLGFELLSHILLGSSAGPLRRALIESGLGEDLSAPTGLQTELHELVFAAGLRGTAPEHKAEVERLILSTLERVADQGLDPDIVEAALRKVEFRSREMRGGAPNGLRLMGKSLRGWLHGGSPEATMRFDEPFAELRRRAAPGSRYFESLIRESLLENRHRATVTVRPDPAHTEREQAAVAARLEAFEAGLTDAGRGQLAAAAERLAALQSEPDTPQAVAAIPFLRVADLPRTLDTIPTEFDSVAGAPLCTHDVFANGVVYLDLVFDLSALPADLLPYVPIYAGVIGELGLPGRGYDEVATEVDLKAGGFHSFAEAGIPLGESRVSDRRVVFRVKALESIFGEALDLTAELLLHSEFANTTRLSELVREARSSMTGSVLPAGHSYAALRAGRSFSDADRLEELWRGATGLLFVDELSRSGVEALSATLARLNGEVISRGNLILNLTAPPEVQAAVRPHIERLVTALPDARRAVGPTGRSAGDPTERIAAEALLVPSDVSYVALALPGARYGTDAHVHEQVLAHLLRTGYLWEHVRMKGGAYGASASARGMDSVFGFSSYRDPRITETLDAYRGALEHYAGGALSREELDLAVIGVTGHSIRPLSPGEKGIAALHRHLYGVTNELRQRNHQMLLGTEVGDVTAAAARLAAALDSGVVVVLGGQEKVDRAAEQLPELASRQVVLPQ